jgi:hypothetical protein
MQGRAISHHLSHRAAIVARITRVFASVSISRIQLINGFQLVKVWATNTYSAKQQVAIHTPPPAKSAQH